MDFAHHLHLSDIVGDDIKYLLSVKLLLKYYKLSQIYSKKPFSSHN